MTSWELQPQRIQQQLPALFTNLMDCKLYHAYADRYYLLLNKVSLEEARANARLLKQALDDSYQVLDMMLCSLPSNSRHP